MRNLTPPERQRIVEIYNQVMGNTCFPQRITIEDVPESQVHGNLGLLNLGDLFQLDPSREDDPFFQIFSTHSNDRKNQELSLYHFKRYERCDEILQKKSISLNTLFSNRSNDYAEYEEFYRRYGPLGNLIPEDYKTSTESVIVARNRKVDYLKNKIFIACFTQSYTDSRFWHDYADNNGLCFRFRFYGFRNDRIQIQPGVNRTVQNLYELRNVCYDTDGYLYDFLNELNYKIGQEMGMALMARGIPIAAQFYKRSKYSWENEIRLAIDLEFVKKRYDFLLESNLEMIDEPNRKAILLPITIPENNPFFGIHLQDVFCSEGFKEYDNVKYILAANFPGVRLWSFEEWSTKRPYTESIY